MKTKKKKESVEKKSMWDGIALEVKHSALSIIFIALTIFFILSPFGKAGVMGDKIFNWLTAFFGAGYFIIPLLFIILAVSLMRDSRPQFARTTVVASFLFFTSTLGIIELLGIAFGLTNKGGWLGNFIEAPLVKLFDVWISFVFLLMFGIISLLVIFNTKLPARTLLFWKKDTKNDEPLSKDENEEESNANEEEATEEELSQEKESEPDEIHSEPEPEQKNSLKKMLGLGTNSTSSFSYNYGSNIKFVPPPLKLLNGDKGKPGFGDIKANSNIIKRTLEKFRINVEMDEVSVGPSITRYALKPAEGVKLSRIVGLQDNLALALAAHPIRIEAPIPGKSLIGIEIPNSARTTVGLGTLLKENAYQSSSKDLLVALGKSIDGKPHFANLAKMPHLLIAGQTGAGKSVTVHALIISLLFRNSSENLRLIMVDPKRVELTLYNDIPHLLTPVITDPQKAIRVLNQVAKEMERRYDILGAEKAPNVEFYTKKIYEPALKKYQEKIAKKKKENANSITDNNEQSMEEDADNIENSPNIPERMPYIVVVIDELATIMSSYPRELEAGIVRLAQLSRAVGIHLILSTQRPQVSVITGLIKANVPSRIALQVSSYVDSKTILDTGGAEKLLGAGDMLYCSGEMSKPIRLQSAFITTEEIKNVVKHIIQTHKEHLPSEIAIDITSQENNTDVIFASMTNDGDSANEDKRDNNDGDSDSELYKKIREFVIQSQKASTSYLQRKFRIGYPRAANIMDELEQDGVVGPSDGAKGRQVLIKPTDSTTNSDDDNDNE
ncbi:DNA translocase FtsK [Patescibacteria group bacterium]|nr:DNA translocase FtsK [Patescibacteria group bacterium]MBU1246618.1 DNA translocase FtsK [Patescibacteria group bacterium]MBU1519127.1 DNA translocase FtsK [Patescibacteria group bacterium]MBU1730367.1 DNA translocase FtsK [Patescibacteria group bacterium]MBU1956354.1 DNA translocase FtsK [Patescibacteria group bacterium]